VFKQAWFYVTFMAVAAIAILFYGQFTQTQVVVSDRSASAPTQVAREPEGAPAGGGEGEAAATTFTEAELIAMGERFYTQLGCSACHSLDGTPMVGPTWKGLYGSEVVLTNGTTVVADEAYLRESIVAPDAKIVRGYAAGVMTATIAPYRSQLNQPGTVDALIAFIKTLK